MLAQKLGTKYQNYFIGGYIASIRLFEDEGMEKPYISIGMKTKNKDKEEFVYIMVYKLVGFGKKYPNPLVKVICDCYDQGRPICCVYYDKGDCNIMSCCYTNFSASALQKEPSPPMSPMVDFEEIDMSDIPF